MTSNFPIQQNKTKQYEHTFENIHVNVVSFYRVCTGNDTGKLEGADSGFKPLAMFYLYNCHAEYDSILYLTMS